MVYFWNKILVYFWSNINIHYKKQSYNHKQFLLLMISIFYPKKIIRNLSHLLHYFYRYEVIFLKQLFIDLPKSKLICKGFYFSTVIRSSSNSFFIWLTLYLKILFLFCLALRFFLWDIWASQISHFILTCQKYYIWQTILFLHQKCIILQYVYLYQKM